MFAATNIVAGNYAQVTPAITASAAYSAGNCVGANFALTVCLNRGGAAFLSNLSVIDKSNQKPALSFLFFNAALAGTYTDKATPALTTDIGKFIGRADVAQADYATFGNDSIGIATEKNLGLLLPNNEGTAILYGVCVTTGTPTFTAVNNLIFTFAFSPLF